MFEHFVGLVFKGLTRLFDHFLFYKSIFNAYLIVVAVLLTFLLYMLNFYDKLLEWNIGLKWVNIRDFTYISPLFEKITACEVNTQSHYFT